MEKRDLMNELQIMVTVGEHPNVISLIGACTRDGKFSELNGSLGSNPIIHWVQIGFKSYRDSDFF